MTGFTAAGITVTNGTVANFQMVDGHTYTFDVMPTADGLVTVTVPAGSAHDAAGNDNHGRILQHHVGTVQSVGDDLDDGQ